MYRSRFEQETFHYVGLLGIHSFFTYIFKQVLHIFFVHYPIPTIQRTGCEGEKYQYGNTGLNIVLWEAQFENSVNVNALSILYRHML
jgi:hypothetical protein